MAVAHAFHHDSRAIRPALENATTTASAVLGDHDTAAGGCGHLLLLPGVVQRQAAAVAGHTAFSDPRSELTCNNNNKYDATWSVVVPRKRARIGGAVDAAGLVMEGHRHRALLPVPQAFAPGGGGEGALGGGSSSSSRVLCSGAASTSGRPSTAAPVSQSQHGILAHLYRHSVEVDALVRIENERLRAGLEEARRRHVRAVVSAVERGAARRLRAAEADLARALARNAELGERVREMGAEGQAWQGIASGHEAAAAGLRATLEQLLLQQAPCAGAADEEGQGEGEAVVEDARSCCFEPERERRHEGGPDDDDDDKQARGSGCTRAACRACGAADACVLLLPCRHLCLCGWCEAVVEACPVCAATKNASLHVLLS
ncbi:probable BOI-related E3 ubiquitin-protein ligase 2 [Sorghum bicolor]|uniref:RING-type domain-containing protein n=1 Tax=Sorghum bicolor TaxID=4558 RepID=A0A194YQ02_SORBI|nr:probable BOI-related E3 ubiquitin-protein ligase 2 [Sorghum bicolor]XP_021314293.1 probable BOI-related E3 ubiquitin-protein ligase 2 [Sorghum bicolor]KXG30313.1 hypothetical protein SORBI_3004G161400 [Sorghum bicolor]OQU85030.1 hypothetical protein SORBI_3004G161400 [Sorghum bicolor]OQU85031.1 hypothetical protein SORBI_3004G161400 [Sorghum bicolor]OQU85032.1 hypothetical protein SORBI_3004G161400 [Sorghum bicolor]OQU85033.1 hypothetical protein SORBI_3004G161400 [Sorghum bicolor]|eukprot:XP_021314292.1 probable BOI-related E3 ubiquitin-protein ligase 2 [Sorghum bicolor]